MMEWMEEQEPEQEQDARSIAAPGRGSAAADACAVVGGLLWDGSGGATARRRLGAQAATAEAGLAPVLLCSLPRLAAVRGTPLAPPPFEAVVAAESADTCGSRAGAAASALPAPPPAPLVHSNTG